MNQRDKMIYLLGQLQALAYPLAGSVNEHNGYYDLVESCIMQYQSILKEFYPDVKVD